MREVYHASSQNGRWGVAIVSDSLPESALQSTYAGRRVLASEPVQGTIRHLGKDGRRHDVYILDHDPDAESWVMVGDDLDPVAGAVRVESMDLQGHSSVSILLLGPDAVVRSYGYRRRNSDVTLYRRGAKQRMSPAVMLALGITPPGGEPEPTPEIPAIGGQLAAALKVADDAE